MIISVIIVITIIIIFIVFMREPPLNQFVEAGYRLN
jgi:hypothetical protein